MRAARQLQQLRGFVRSDKAGTHQVGSAGRPAPPPVKPESVANVSMRAGLLTVVCMGLLSCGLIGYWLGQRNMHEGLSVKPSESIAGSSTSVNAKPVNAKPHIKENALGLGSHLLALSLPMPLLLESPKAEPAPTPVAQSPAECSVQTEAIAQITHMQNALERLIAENTLLEKETLSLEAEMLGLEFELAGADASCSHTNPGNNSVEPVNVYDLTNLPEGRSFPVRKVKSSTSEVAHNIKYLEANYANPEQTPEALQEYWDTSGTTPRWKGDEYLADSLKRAANEPHQGNDVPVDEYRDTAVTGQTPKPQAFFGPAEQRVEDLIQPSLPE